MHERTAYQSGYEDAHDRGWLASGLPKHGDIGEYTRGYRDGEEALKKQLPSSRIVDLEEALRLMGESLKRAWQLRDNEGRIPDPFFLAATQRADEKTRANPIARAAVESKG